MTGHSAVRFAALVAPQVHRGIHQQMTAAMPPRHSTLVHVVTRSMALMMALDRQVRSASRRRIGDDFALNGWFARNGAIPQLINWRISASTPKKWRSAGVTGFVSKNTDKVLLRRNRKVDTGPVNHGGLGRLAFATCGGIRDARFTPGCRRTRCQRWGNRFTRPSGQFGRPSDQNPRPCHHFPRPSDQNGSPCEGIARPSDRIGRSSEEIPRPCDPFCRPSGSFTRPSEENGRPSDQIARMSRQGNGSGTQ